MLAGRLDLPTDYPEELVASGPDRWRFHRDFSLTYARRAAGLGNRIVALGQLARAAVEEAHARHAERRSWVLNEKRILDPVGLSKAVDCDLPSDVELAQLVERTIERLVGPAAA